MRADGDKFPAVRFLHEAPTVGGSWAAAESISLVIMTNDIPSTPPGQHAGHVARVAAYSDLCSKSRDRDKTGTRARMRVP